MRLLRLFIRHNLMPCCVISDPTVKRPLDPTSDKLAAKSPTPELDQLLHERSPTPDQSQTMMRPRDQIQFPIGVRLPTGTSITVRALRTDTVKNFKSKIEAVEAMYPSCHQRLVDPGYCDDLNDDKKVVHYVFIHNLPFLPIQTLNPDKPYIHLIMRGKISLIYGCMWSSLILK